MSMLRLSNSGFRQNKIWLQTLIIIISIILPLPVLALEQLVNPGFTGGDGGWTIGIISNGSYQDSDCDYDGTVGDPPGSVEAMIECKNSFKSDSTMLSECYQPLFGGNALASAAHVDIRISDYYRVNLFSNVPPSNWSISLIGGIYKASDGTLLGTFREEKYEGNTSQIATGPFRPATWTALLPAGEAYTLKLNWGLFVAPYSQTTGNKPNFVYHWFDKVYCNTSPSGLQVAENVTGTASLTWNPSTTLAGGDYALDYYNVYSSTSSGGPWTFVASTNSAAFEHNPTEDDLYYCVEDVDRYGNKSPKSVECLYRRTRIEITQVFSPKTSVTQGQGGVPVTVTLMNPGSSDILFGGASLTFKIPAVGQYNWSLISPAIGSPISRNGGTLSLSFSVDVLATSLPQSDWIDATATGTISTAGRNVYDTSAIATHAWLIRSPAKLKVLSVTTPATVYIGQTGVPVDVLVENEGDDNAAALWDITDLKFSWGSYLNIIPQTTLPIAVYAGQASSVRYLLEVNPNSATGAATIDAWIKFRDANLLIPSANNDGATFKGQWTIVAGFVNTFKDASRDIPQTSFNVGDHTAYARAENLMPLKEHRMRWYEPGNPVPVQSSNPAITTDGTGLFDDERTSFSTPGTWRVTCTRVFDSIVLAEKFFEVGNPASLTLSVALPGSVSLGQTFVATVTVNNIGSATAVDVELATMTLATGSATWISGPVPVRQDISGESSRSYLLQWQATALGNLRLQCAAFGFDDNVVVDPKIWAATSPSNICIVQTPPSLTITSLNEVYNNVSRGQEDLIVDIRVTNSGQADAIFDAASLGYAPVYVNQGHTETVVSPAFGTPIPGGGYLDIRFHVDIAQTADVGPRTISATVSGYDANNPTAIVTAPASGTGNWVILAYAGLLSANGSTHTPEQYAFNDDQTIYGKFIGTTGNNDYFKIAVYDDVNAPASPTLILSDRAPGVDTEIVIPSFKPSQTGSTNYRTWRIDLLSFTRSGQNYIYNGVVGNLYFENKQPGYLTGDLRLSPDPVEVGATVTVTLCVENPVATGSTIAGVTPTLPVPTAFAAGSLSDPVGPIPASAGISPGFPATFTWFYRAQTISGLPPASYSMIATFTGTDLNSGIATSGSDMSNSIVIAQRQIALASATIGFGDMKVGQLKWVGPSAVVNTGNVKLTNVSWRPSHLIHTNAADQIHRSYVTFSPVSNFAIDVSSSQPASFSLTIPYNQPTGTYTVQMDVFDDYYIINAAREVEEPVATFTVQVNVLETAIVDVNETLIDLGNWPQDSITTAKTISALNLGNVNLSSLEFEMLDDGGLSATTTVTIFPVGPLALATDGVLLASISADVWEFEAPGVYLMNWCLKDTAALEASDTFQVRIGIGSMGLILDPLPIDMGNGTPTFTITDIPFTIENTGDLDLTKLKLVKGDLTYVGIGTGTIPGENIIPELPAVVASNTTVAATMSLYVSAGVPVGDYSGGQTIYEDLNGNDERDIDEPSFNFFMIVHVNEYRAIQVESGTIDFGGRIPGEAATISFKIRNIGSVKLEDLVWNNVDLFSAETPVATLSKIWYEFLPPILPLATFSLEVGELYDAVGSITIDAVTPQPDGNYTGNPVALLFDDKINPGSFNPIDDPYDSFTVKCAVGGKSLAIVQDPITILGAEPGSTSDSAFFEVQNTGKLILKKTKAKAITDLISPTASMPASVCIFTPTVFDAMSESQTKSAYWSVAVPPGTSAGTYTATLLVWNDDNDDGECPVGSLEASDTATLQIEVVSKRIIRVEPNPADLGFVPAGQTGSINISIYNDGNINILNNIRLHKVPLDPVSPGPTPIATITMIPAIATNSLPVETMVNATIQVVVPVGQTGYPYSGQQVMFIDEPPTLNGVWDPATEVGATFTLSLTVGQKLLSAQPLIDFGTITAVGPHNKAFWVKNDTTTALSYGTWDEISQLTFGANKIPSNCLEFIPTNFTVSSLATKGDCIASLTILSSQPPGLYIGTYTAFEDDNGNGFADGFEASATFQVQVNVGDIPAVEIITLSPLNLGNIEIGIPSPDVEVSYRNIGNVALMLDWAKANMSLIPGAGDAITLAEINFSSPIPVSLPPGKYGTCTVSITPSTGRTVGVYSGVQILRDGTLPGLPGDALTLECNVTAVSSGPEVASGSVYQEVATLTWTPPGATWIMSAWVSLDDTASAAIRLLEVDADGNQNWRGIEIDSKGEITPSLGISGSGVVLSSNAGGRTWHRVYFSFTGPDLAIASNTYMVLQNTTEHTASQSVLFDGVQLEKAGDGQTRPAPYTSDKILVSPNRKQTLDGKYRYNEW